MKTVAQNCSGRRTVRDGRLARSVIRDALLQGELEADRRMDKLLHECIEESVPCQQSWRGQFKDQTKHKLLIDLLCIVYNFNQVDVLLPNQYARTCRHAGSTSPLDPNPGTS